jgi:hypothetical protein
MIQNSTRRQLRLKIKWTSEQIDRKIFYAILREKIPKQVVETSSRLQQIGTGYCGEARNAAMA